MSITEWSTNTGAVTGEDPDNFQTGDILLGVDGQGVLWLARWSPETVNALGVYTYARATNTTARVGSYNGDTINAVQRAYGCPLFQSAATGVYWIDGFEDPLDSTKEGPGEPELHLTTPGGDTVVATINSGAMNIVCGLAWHTDGDKLLTMRYDNSTQGLDVLFIDPMDGAILQTLNTGLEYDSANSGDHGATGSLMLGPNATYYFLFGNDDSGGGDEPGLYTFTVTSSTIANVTKRQSIAPGNVINAFAVSPDGTICIVEAGNPGTVTIYAGLFDTTGTVVTLPSNIVIRGVADVGLAKRTGPVYCFAVMVVDETAAPSVAYKVAFISVTGEVLEVSDAPTAVAANQPRGRYPIYGGDPLDDYNHPGHMDSMGQALRKFVVPQVGV